MDQAQFHRFLDLMFRCWAQIPRPKYIKVSPLLLAHMESLPKLPRPAHDLHLHFGCRIVRDNSLQGIRFQLADVW